MWVAAACGAREKAWWAGEHEGYWLDGFVRSAILTGDARRLEEIERRVGCILRAFSRTGYIGSTGRRIAFPNADSTASCGRRAACSRRCSPGMSTAATRESRRPSQPPSPPRSTGTGGPPPSAVWLCDDYSAVGDGFFTDLAADRMRDPRIAWFDRAAHVAEALHLPAKAGALSGRPDILEAAANVHARLARHTNPGGGLAIGELEFIRGAAGRAHRPSETCANVELAISLGRLAVHDPSVWMGDLQERVILNAVQGARLHPSYLVAAYLTRDNRRHAADADAHAGRELFSPCHEAAACCVLYGPCTVETRVGGVDVRIDELTADPFSDEGELIVVVTSPVDFEVRRRVPEGSGDPEVRADAGVRVRREPREICLCARWSGRSRVRLGFLFEPRTVIQPDGTEAYRCWGPLVFGLPFAHRRETRAQVRAQGAAGSASGFPGYLLHPQDEPGWDYLTRTDDAFRIASPEGDGRFPWAVPPVGLERPRRRRDGSRSDARLLPMGSSSLRRVTFPVDRSGDADAPKFAPSADGMREA